MKLTSDTNMIVARIKKMAIPAAKMECGLEVVSMMNAVNEAVLAYDMGRKAAMIDRRFYVANSVINGHFAHYFVNDEEAEDRVIEQAIRVGEKLAKRLDEIEQKEFEEFIKLK
jgi:hypothetical protein